MKFRWQALMLSLVMLGAGYVGVGFAQNTNSGDLRGTVTDTTGAIIPGATVTVVNNNTGVVKTLTTNGDGLRTTCPTGKRSTNPSLAIAMRPSSVRTAYCRTSSTGSG